MLELIHKVEKDIGRRLTDAEYSQVLNYVESELRLRSIRNGLQDLYKMFGG
jgi:hypothetical protein